MGRRSGWLRFMSGWRRQVALGGMVAVVTVWSGCVMWSGEAEGLYSVGVREGCSATYVEYCARIELETCLHACVSTE